MPPKPRAPPPSPTPPDLVAAPELAALALLDAALRVAVYALVAEHPTLIDELRRHGDDGRVVDLADVICRRALSLGDLIERYVSATRAAFVSPSRGDDDDGDLPF